MTQTDFEEKYLDKLTRGDRGMIQGKNLKERMDYCMGMDKTNATIIMFVSLIKEIEELKEKVNGPKD